MVRDHPYTLTAAARNQRVASVTDQRGTTSTDQGVTSVADQRASASRGRVCVGPFRTHRAPMEFHCARRVWRKRFLLRLCQAVEVIGIAPSASCVALIWIHKAPYPQQPAIKVSQVSAINVEQHPAMNVSQLSAINVLPQVEAGCVSG